MASFPDEGHDPLVRSRPRPEIDPDLDDVAQLVHEEFDHGLDPRIVDECLGQVAARFAGARIRSFVPLLVRRYVREELQARHGQVELKSESPPHMPTGGAALSHTAAQRPDDPR
jgi:hypothetical protein